MQHFIKDGKGFHFIEMNWHGTVSTYTKVYHGLYVFQKENVYYKNVTINA